MSPCVPIPGEVGLVLAESPPGGRDSTGARDASDSGRLGVPEAHKVNAGPGGAARLGWGLRRTAAVEEPNRTAMSAVNSDYDPVEVTPLTAEGLGAVVTDALTAFAAAPDLAALATAETAHAKGRSPLALAKREIGALPPAARKDAGTRWGHAQARVAEALARRHAELEADRDARVLAEETVDVTVPVVRAPLGARHPVTTITDAFCDVFVALGYEVLEGPEVETEWHNFDALRLGPDHPARSMQDTIYVDPPERGLLLRTQTSPVQIRALLAGELPLYAVAPGRTYRADALDATHAPAFHQIEGIVVDRGITMADLKGTLDHAAAALFGPAATTRLRPSYFPFTEPSAEMDLRCPACHGTGCRTCSGAGWIEWGGCGVMHPGMLRSAGVDPDVWSGFAFGIGLERTVMFRNGVGDLRDLVEGDVRASLPYRLEA